MSIQRILVIGSGGREHALAWRLARDTVASEVLVAPGNDGIARSFRCLPVPESDAAGLIAACRRELIDLVVIGPEAPLASGLADALSEAGVVVFGPGCQAARLESSKWFAKTLMREAGVPTARAQTFTGIDAARAALRSFDPPWVIKADGLAAGKGVCVTRDSPEAERFMVRCLEQDRFGAAGRRILIEEFLEGEEASVMAITDGDHFVLLPAARDYKRAYDGDRGANTGGMGAHAPAEAVDEATERRIAELIVAPVLAAMRARGTPYRGVLYCGLMLTAGEPRVVEFNCRFGDPETEVIMPLVEGDLAAVLAGAARGSLEPQRMARAKGAVVAVALVDRSYPEASSRAGGIEGLEELMSDSSLMVFHAGTAFEAGGWRIHGGRAAYVTAWGPDHDAARARVYGAIDRLRGEGFRFRRDIGARARASEPGDLPVVRSGGRGV